MFFASPHIAVLGKEVYPDDFVETFKIYIREDEEPFPDLDQVVRTESLTSKPESIEDLLRWDTEETAALNQAPRREAEIPELAQRLASEELERTHDLEPETDRFASIDTKIIEIAASTARSDIEIVRRFVKPSPERVLEEGATPLLRGRDGEGNGDIINMRAVVDSSPAESRQEVKRLPDMKMLDSPEERLRPPPPDEGLPLLPIELEIARRPIVEAIHKSSSLEFIDDLVRIDIETYSPSNEAYGYFRLRISPAQKGEMEILPKNVTFVVDASKSILQSKLDRTVEGINRIVEDLRDHDKFNIVIFRDAPKRLSESPLLATRENKAIAREFLEGLEARGGTDVYEAIRSVLHHREGRGVPDIVVVTTDGRPTTGVRDARDIINALTAENKEGISILAYGSGKTANRYLLDLLAYRNKGESFVTAQLDDIDKDLPAFFQRMTDPILVDLKVDYGQIEEEEVFPRELPDFFKEKAIMLYGRYDPRRDKNFVMRLVGRAGERTKELVFRADLTNGATGNDEIARGWAFQKTYHLIGEICRVGESAELSRELRILGNKYGIKTSYN